jgi:hypothetical protein
VVNVSVEVSPDMYSNIPAATSSEAETDAASSSTLPPTRTTSGKRSARDEGLAERAVNPRAAREVR